MSSTTARTWATIIAGDTASTAVTATVFCAVMAVIAVVPCTPARAKAFRSAWIPAPPPESEPAIDRQTGMRPAARARRRRIGGRGQASARNATAETAVGVLGAGIARQQDLFVGRGLEGDEAVVAGSAADPGRGERREQRSTLRGGQLQRLLCEARREHRRRRRRARTASPPGSRVSTA